MILNESVSSVDALAAADSETAVVDMLSAESKQNPRNHVQTSEMRARVECWLQQLSEKQRELVSWLQQLPKKQQEIICRRFRLRGFDADTLENVGVEVGLTRERVKQIQIKALQQLKILILEKG